MSGRPYSAGGIRTTVEATRAATDAEIDATLTRLLAEALRQGTTTQETKSGYGLTTYDEARALEIAARHTDEVTYLGAHVVAPEFADDPAGYVALVTGAMLDACAPHARWVDVFCERGAFDGDQARAVLTAGMSRGLIARVHANQLGPGPGVQLAVELGAASADHCTHLTGSDVDALASAADTTVATLLPGAEFSTRARYPDARRLLDAGATVALSTDCNPGSSFTTSMPFCVAVAVRDMGMTPDEAVHAATYGGAQALRRRDIGRITPGARADLLLLDAPSHVHLAYRPGCPWRRRCGRTVCCASSAAPANYSSTSRPRRSRDSVRVSSRDTCICEMPSSSPISACVRLPTKRSERMARSRCGSPAISGLSDSTYSTPSRSWSS